MTRSMFAAALLMLLWGAIGSGLAQEGGWLGAQLTSVTTAAYDVVKEK